MDLNAPGKGYESLRMGLAHLEEGDLDRAQGCFAEARTWAIDRGDHDLADRALCNHSGVRIALEQSVEPITGLRKVLMTGRDPENCFLAAYNIARAYEFTKEHRKGLFYAQLARDRADRVEKKQWRAWSLNQLGNALLALSRPDEANDSYREALRILGSSNEAWAALVVQNLGYCLLALGETREAFAHFVRSRRMQRRCGGATSLLHLDLAWLHLEIDRPRHAMRHARRALDIAQREGIEADVKNALFLLGDSLRRLGDREGARELFVRLESYYADRPFVAELLLNIDVRPLVSLRA